MRIANFIFVFFVVLGMNAQGIKDTTQLREVVVMAAKESRPLREQSLSSLSLNANNISERNIHDISDLTNVVPGLFIPAYGSAQTTAIYMRGIGSRTNTPAVGLYVDDIPWLEKSSFSSKINEIERIEVLRGPQNTLFGRNSMGGLIRITTKNPIDYQGTVIERSMGNHYSHYTSVSHYQRFSEKLGFTVGVGYRSDGQYFKNDISGMRADADRSLRAHTRLLYRPSDVVNIDFHANYELCSQDAFPYYLESVSDNDYFKDQLTSDIGRITSNDENTYLRHLLNIGLKAEHNWPKVTLSNVLAFQLLNDDMKMDQDFSHLSIYTLQQKQRSRTLSEEIALKNRPGAWRHWEWSTGVSLFYQWSHAIAPVGFGKDGVSWITDLMNTNANAHMPQVVSGPMTMDFAFSDQITSPELRFDGFYDTPTNSAALYHQSTLCDLFNVKGLDLTMGLRLEYEHAGLSYDTWYDFSHQYSLSGHLTMPTMSRDVAMVPATDFDVSNRLQGSLSHDWWQLMPRFSLQYSFPKGNVYGTISRGYRSGGYNFQMFSEVLQSMMRSDIMRDVANVTIPVLEAQPSVPAQTKAKVTDILNSMAEQPAVDVSALCLYRPEYAWNYEVGTHLNLFENRLFLDASVFMTNVSDQQIAQMAPSGLGRITVNAGRSRTYGGELALRSQITDRLQAHASYGYTHATFTEYQLSSDVSYEGNYVPFTPQHSVDLGAKYAIPLPKIFNRQLLDRMVISSNWHGLGKIYWTEDNQVSEPFYTALDAKISFYRKHLELGVWAANIYNSRCRTFYFQSMNRGYSQRNKPFQCGFELKLNF
ncbi:MAG: TonB-dependent receptor [Bacteroidaceae bacterium]|nr:TonB-dependent receptor [Bacteroidaceae bacterium]